MDSFTSKFEIRNNKLTKKQTKPKQNKVTLHGEENKLLEIRYFRYKSIPIFIRNINTSHLLSRKKQ